MKIKSQTYACHLLRWNEYLSGWSLGKLDLPTIAALDKEVSLYHDHLVRLYEGTAPPSCYKDGEEEAAETYDFQNKTGTRLEASSPYSLAVVVEHDIDGADFEVTTSNLDNSSHWASYYRLKPAELQTFLTQLFDPHDTVSLGHRIFPVMQSILSCMEP